MTMLIIKLILLIIPLTVLFIFMRTLPGAYSSRNENTRSKRKKNKND